MAKKSLKTGLTKPRPRGASSVTVERILDAAQQVLITSGYAGLTMRLVARSARISPGNLTYHFPTKNALLGAVIGRLLEYFSRQINDSLCNPEVPVAKKIESLVNMALMEGVTEGTVRIARELWAMALHDDVIREMADDFYDDLMERIVTALQGSHPNADKATIQEIVHVLLLLSEGTIVLFGTRRERAVSIERIIELTTPMLETLETNRPAPDGVSG
jgi:AcrR family transcriptional regulator